MSLLFELKKHAPLSGKCFSIKLVPVDAAFRKKRPTYKGKDRYEVSLVPAPARAGTKPMRESGPANVEEVVVGDD